MVWPKSAKQTEQGVTWDRWRGTQEQGGAVTVQKIAAQLVRLQQGFTRFETLISGRNIKENYSYKV